ncbi:hypothetical protein RvY_00663-1 [Ramazzottius varieornatus]|uniref:dual-specificity kinase n=1 Tax=Ramazzottius varieornatus TaxID=947166 RepID=A0A1D1UDJ8_RAMVA|nr:hypothetical protein RvY_00663-1 [Ramazzottius varieornatus]
MDSEMEIDDLDQTVVNMVDASTMNGTENTTKKASSSSGPLTPKEALFYYRNILTPYEQRECSDYPEIYFVGEGADKVKKGKHNHGFDTTSRSYIAHTHDHIAYRYELVKLLGKGYSSAVYVGYDHKTNTKVALKIFRADRKCKLLAAQEENILRHLNETYGSDDSDGNIIRLIDAFTFRRHRVLVLERLYLNLYDFVKHLPNQMLGPVKVRAIAQSFLKALIVLNKEKIVHCDLKPENVMFRQEGRTGIKLVDFGTSCRVGQQTHDYIGSRYYRAPEIVLGLGYDCASDMWSYGCILLELLIGFPFFYADSEQALLALMIEALGLPPTKMVEACRNVGQGEDKGQVFAAHFLPDGSPRCLSLTAHHTLDEPAPEGAEPRHVVIKAPKSRPVKKVLAHCKNPMVVDFIERCLEWEPSKRMTPLQAHVHPWIKLTPVRTPEN